MCGFTWQQIAERIEKPTSFARRRANKHNELVLLNPDYRDRAAQVAYETLEPVVGLARAAWSRAVLPCGRWAAGRLTLYHKEFLTTNRAIPSKLDRPAFLELTPSSSNYKAKSI
ncbi:MAG: hypothetical protein H6830_12965 [Planctomycetes bacterium]|nr:hypothetical protein [Planctomycetota bacterium]MCB9912888.1 hypothetical protein [Planctomycetota bacterium]